MASTWPGPSYVGPWICDDTAVLGDGIESGGTGAWPYGKGLPTVDGLRAEDGRRRRSRPDRDREFEVLGITTGYK